MSPGQIKRIRGRLQEMERSLQAVEAGKSEEHYQLYLVVQTTKLAEYVATEAFLNLAPAS